MSRSYKKHPYCTNNSHRAFAKRQANKKIRKYKKKIWNGGSFKHLYCSWEICDWKKRYPWKTARAEYKNFLKSYYYLTPEEYYRRWIKIYKNK